MSSAYVYRKRLGRSKYKQFRRRLILTTLVLALFGGVAFYIYSGYHSAKTQKPVTSGVETSYITGNKTTFFSDYFQFQDTGTWVLDKNDSTTTKLTYHKFNKNVQAAEMVVYINQVPISLYLATPRVLPVRIVNDNSLVATNVSDPCGQLYAKNELHQVKELTVGNATMLCDPDSSEYYIVLAEIGGDYRLNLKRPNGTPIQFVITYKDVGLAPQPDAILNIANSLQTR